MNVRTAVLVEGFSDRLAVEALAQRLGRHLASDGIAVLPIGGAPNIGAFVRHLVQAVTLEPGPPSGLLDHLAPTGEASLAPTPDRRSRISVQ